MNTSTQRPAAYIRLTQAPAEGAGVHRTDIEWCDCALGGLVRWHERRGERQP